MSKSFDILIAGFGGQGILFTGKMIAQTALNESKEVSWLPSYGPEMRGGTANCTVVVSDKTVSCPLIYEADSVVAMNLPSMLKFESIIKPGGALFINSSLISQKPTRTDIKIYEVPIKEISDELGNSRVANMVMLGAFIRHINVLNPDSVKQVIRESLGAKKAELLDLNLRAFDLWKQ